MYYRTYNQSEKEIAQLKKKNTALKIIAVLLLVATVVSLVFAREQYLITRMNTYAFEHNCEWIYSYYLNEEPVCK